MNFVTVCLRLGENKAVVYWRVWIGELTSWSYFLWWDLLFTPEAEAREVDSRPTSYFLPFSTLLDWEIFSNWIDLKEFAAEFLFPVKKLNWNFGLSGELGSSCAFGFTAECW